MRRPSQRPNAVVLIADDVDERALAELLLQRQGFRVQGSSDGVDGLERVRRDGAAVVVLGMAKHWQNLELVRRLRGRFEPIPLPAQPRIVVASPDLDDAGERFTRSLGADAVLRQSVAEGDVLNAVGQLARRESLPGTAVSFYEAS